MQSSANCRAHLPIENPEDTAVIETAPKMGTSWQRAVSDQRRTRDISR